MIGQPPACTRDTSHSVLLFILSPHTEMKGNAGQGSRLASPRLVSGQWLGAYVGTQNTC
jgi:hypothetical protein